MRAVVPLLRDHRRPLAITFAMATLARLLTLADPQILRLILDRYVLRLDVLPRPEFVRGVLVLIGISVLVGVLARALRTAQEYEVAVIARRVGATLYAKSISHSLLLPYRDFETRRAGELLHIIQRAREEAETAIGGVVRLYLGALALAVVTAYAFTVHPALGLVHLVVLPAVGALMLMVSAPIRKRQREITREAATLTGSTTEAIRNVELVRSLGISAQEIDRLGDANERILALEEKKLRLVRRFNSIEGALFHGMRAVLLGTMLWLVYERAITTGEFLSLFLYSSLIFTPLVEAGAAIVRYQETRATFDTLDVMLERPREAHPVDPAPLGTITTIAFDGVSLWHDPTRPPALRDVRVSICAGQTIALTGPSGAGKSSLVKLLVGLYPPAEGALLVNGRDLRTVDLDAFRARIGLVTQETQLFAGTIRENLQIARPDASDADCRLALQQAAALSLLTRAAEGLETRIGEGGMTLSGGERQRLAIARALLRSPDVLVFDEATSHLDSLTERAITATIRSLSGPARLTLLVSHRLATITHADCIHVLAHGQIEESGRHEELLARRGLYATLWQEQNRARHKDEAHPTLT